MAVQWHAANGEPQRRKAIARRDAYHGVTLGALSFTGIPVCRTAFEPMAVPTRHVSNTNAYRHPLGDDEDAFCSRPAGRDRGHHRVRGRRHGRDADRRAGAERGRLPGAPARLLAGPARAVRPARDPALLGRGDLRVRADRDLVRRPALRLRAGHDHLREGAHRRPLRHGRPARLGSGGRALPRRTHQLPARRHVRGPSGRRRHGARRARRRRARGRARQRDGQRAGRA